MWYSFYKGRDIKVKIILASSSPRRRELLKLITEDFESISTDVDETLPENTDPFKASEYLSLIKAKAVEYSSENIVIGCDTTVIIDNKILGKPNNINQCR